MPEAKKPAQTTEPKKWSEMTPEEQEATEKRLLEKLRKYYANRPSREYIQGSMENQDGQSRQKPQKHAACAYKNASKNNKLILEFFGIMMNVIFNGDICIYFNGDPAEKAIITDIFNNIK